MTVMKTELPQLKSYDRLLIGGAWVKPSTSDTIEVFSPSTEAWLAMSPRRPSKMWMRR